MVNVIDTAAVQKLLTLFCPLERHYTVLSSAWRFWQAALDFGRSLNKRPINQNVEFERDSKYLGISGCRSEYLLKSCFICGVSEAFFMLRG